VPRLPKEVAMIRDKLIKTYMRAVAKYDEGAGKYGEFDPHTDVRDLIAEAEDEIIDAINYLAMFLAKLEALKDVTTKNTSTD
jgi:hypothetical protein